MRRVLLLFITTQLFGCTSPVPYAWQDINQPARNNATSDLEECRIYAAKQYRPGIPAGEPYLGKRTEKGDETVDKNNEWRPDRSPFPTTNINAQPIYDVQVDYTGYPGELDYSPGYLDAILAKCMYDRGWEYKPVISDL